MAKKAGYETVEQYQEYLEGTVTETSQYSNTKGKKKTPIMSAMKDNGEVMDIKEFCSHYGQDYDKLKSWKLVSHTGVPYYNIAFYETVIEPVVS